MQHEELGLAQRMGRLAVCVVAGAAIWFSPAPQAVPVEAWRLFAVFVAVIVSFIFRPYPMGPMVLLGLVTLVAARVVTLDEALAGFGDSTVWLVVAAFLIAGTVVRSGLGQRIALTLVKRFGRSMLGLGYAICGAELILGPVIPSNTARGGGTLAPIVRSLGAVLGSHPDDRPERAGRYLILLGSQANLITAAMFLTGMAANPLVARAAKDVFGIQFGWNTWALGAIVPGLVGLLLLPLFVYRLERPTLTDTRPAQQVAGNELLKMGPWTRQEIGVALVLVGMVLLWMTKAVHGIGTTTVAWIGVSILLLTRIESWDNFTASADAWDALVWLGGLLTMADLLRDHGLVTWFAGLTGAWVGGLGGLRVLVPLALIYFYSMYGFSMLTGHISALLAAFFAVALSAGAPPLLTVALLAYFSSLCGSVTYYSTGPVIIYFGFGYIPSHQWFVRGFLVSLFHLAIWLTVGMAWWKWLGWW